MLTEKSSDRVAIDGRVIACTSERNDLSEFGYKAAKLGTEQANWLTAYDVVSKEPLLSQIYSGADPDKVSVKALFDRYHFTNTEFLADRGFNAKADKELMSQNGNTYIVPMISSRKDYKYVLEKLHFNKRRYFVYNKNSYASMICYQKFTIGGTGIWLIRTQQGKVLNVRTTSKQWMPEKMVVVEVSSWMMNHTSDCFYWKQMTGKTLRKQYSAITNAGG